MPYPEGAAEDLTRGAHHTIFPSGGSCLPTWCPLGGVSYRYRIVERVPGPTAWKVWGRDIVEMRAYDGLGCTKLLRTLLSPQVHQLLMVDGRTPAAHRQDTCLTLHL